MDLDLLSAAFVPRRMSAPVGPAAPAAVPARAQPASSSYTPAQPETGFYRHVRSAIQNNQTRKAYYAKASGGASTRLSNELLTLERLVLPLAAYFDHQAARLNQQGVGVVRDDFVAMDQVADPSRAPRYRKQATAEDWAQLETWLDRYEQDAGEALRQRDFRTVAILSDQLVTRLEGLEASSQSHFAMTKHLVESVGYAAANGVRYRAASQGASDDLVQRFLRVQTMGLIAALPLDRQAQPLQAKGIGILVNDLPAIPLHAAVAQLP